MPAGVGWFQYSTFFVAAMASMLAGAQFVHTVYRPLDDMETLVNIEMKKLENEMGKPRVSEESDK